MAQEKTFKEKKNQIYFLLDSAPLEIANLNKELVLLNFDEH